MLASKSLLLASVGSSSIAGCVVAAVLLQMEGLTIVERYGILGLLAVVVVGIGGGILKLGWQQIRLISKMNGKIESMDEKIDDIRHKLMD